MTPNDFLKIIHDSLHKQYEPAPKGWYSAKELSKIWKKSMSVTSRNLRHGVKLGLLEKKYYFIKDKNGSMHKTAHYFFHEKENNQKTNKREVMENTIRSRRKNR